MSQQKATHSTEQRIVEAAKTLFLTQGFNKTSVRQIVADAGVTTGSLYHFFSGKDDMLKAIVSEHLAVLYEVSEQKTQATQGKPYMPFFYELTLFLRLINSKKNLRDLMARATESVAIADSIVESRTALLQQWFSPFNPQFTHRDYYHRAIFVKGMMRSILMYKIAHPFEHIDEQLHLLTETCAKMFNVPEDEFAAIYQQIRAVTDDDLPDLGEV